MDSLGNGNATGEIQTDETGAPYEIWLQLHGDENPAEALGPADCASGDVTWCWHQNHNYDVPYVRRDVLSRLMEDDADADTFIRSEAAKVLTDFEINGDSYGVPTPADIVERLVKRIQASNT